MAIPADMRESARAYRLPLVYRRNNAKKEILVRLMKLQRQQQQAMEEDRPRPPDPRMPQPPKPKIPDSPTAKLYEPKLGYANYYFNKLERDHLLSAFRKHGDFSKLQGTWSLRTSGLLWLLRSLDLFAEHPMVTYFEVLADAAP